MKMNHAEVAISFSKDGKSVRLEVDAKNGGPLTRTYLVELLVAAAGQAAAQCQVDRPKAFELFHKALFANPAMEVPHA